MKFLLLEEVGSTNSYAAVHAAELDDMTMILADAQRALPTRDQDNGRPQLVLVA